LEPSPKHFDQIIEMLKNKKIVVLLTEEFTLTEEIQHLHSIEPWPSNSCLNPDGKRNTTDQASKQYSNG